MKAKYGKIKRKISIVLITVIVSGSFVTLPVRGEVVKTGIEIIFNGEKIPYTANYGYPFIDENDRTQVPFRKTLEFIGAKVSWNNKDRIAIAEYNDIVVEVPIGEKYIIKNGEKILNDTVSVIIGTRTYLPVRIVLEAFGCDVSWDAENYHVLVSLTDEVDLFTRIPSRYDLRETNQLTAVRDQLTTGACWAFASLGAIESVLAPKTQYDFSEDHMSLSHGYNLSQENGGHYLIALGYLTRWSGPVLEKDDVFNDGILNEEAVVQKHIQEAQFIPKKDYSGIKIAVMLYGGVQSSIYLASTNIDRNTKYYNADYHSYNYTGTKGINHDIVIVGWDDNYPKDNFVNNATRNGAFIAKNSHGVDFGEDGYFYISYDDINVGTQNLVYTRVEAVTNYDRLYQSDWLGNVGLIGYGEESAYFSSVYTTKGDELLEAVGFYATDQRTSYEVYVVQSYEDTTDFAKKELVKKGTFDYGGYYTIDIDIPIEINGQFAVVVKITTPGSEFPVASEFQKELEWIGEVDITDGEGYMSYDGITWNDTEDELSANVCLKVYTDTLDLSIIDTYIPLELSE